MHKHAGGTWRTECAHESHSHWLLEERGMRGAWAARYWDQCSPSDDDLRDMVLNDLACTWLFRRLTGDVVGEWIEMPLVQIKLDA